MSTTHSTSDIPYTIVGGTRVQRSGPGVRGLSAVMLDRGSLSVRSDSIEHLAGSGADEVIAVLGPSPHYDVEQLAGRIENSRFLLLDRPVSAGEQINVAIHEAMFPLVLVLWSDTGIGRISDRVIELALEKDAICSVPSIRNEKGMVVPSVSAPAFHGSRFRTIPAQPGKGTRSSLYPFDYAGLYSREKFEALGGYDAQITNPYWQKMDFGFRSYLWGESIAVIPELRFEAQRAIPDEDTTPDASYARFHLKNLAVRFSGDSGRIPLRQLFSLLLRSGLGPAKAFRLFRESRSWVRDSRYRFIQDARRVTELWEVDS